MQYLLTQLEFDDLRRISKFMEESDAVKREDPQKLCTDAANHIPVFRPWSDPNTEPKTMGMYSGSED